MFWFVIIGILVGCLLPLQPLINAKLSHGTGLPVFAALVNFAGGAVLLFSLFIAMGFQWPEVKKLSSVPWYAYLGGLLGCIFVISGIYLVPRLGATVFFVALLTGQLGVSLLVDHYSLLGAPENSLSLARIMGVGLVGMGLFFIYK